MPEGVGGSRVAVVVQTFPVPSETFVVDHVVGLERAGWSPVVVCNAVNTKNLQVVRAQLDSRLEVELLGTPSNSLPRLVAAAPALMRGSRYAPRLMTRRYGLSLMRRAVLLEAAFRRLQPAVVHAHFADNGISAAVAARREFPVVVDFHGWDFNVFPREFGWARIRQALRGCTLVAHSEFAEQRIRGGIGWGTRRVRLGVDLQMFGGRERGESWPRRMNWLVVGRLRALKGQETAIRALALADGELADTELTLAGDGPDRAALERLATTLGVGERVRFTGPLSHSDVAREMARADVLLVPSMRTSDGSEESFGRVVLEGLASGLPVIASDIGGLPEAVGDVGWTVPAGNHAALVECVRHVIRNRSPQESSRRSKARAREFSIETMWRDYDTVTSAVCHRGAAGSER